MKAKEYLSNVDKAWLRMERPDNLMVITGVLTFDGSIDFDTLRTVFQDRFVAPYPRFRQRLHDPASRKPFWSDDPDFDINNHLHRVTLPNPDDTDSFQKTVNRLMSTPLDFEKALWEGSVVNGFDNQSALIIRIHHCIADGIALIQVLLSLTNEGPDIVPMAHRNRKAQPRDPMIDLLGTSSRSIPRVLTNLGGGLVRILRLHKVGEVSLQGLRLLRAVYKLTFMRADSSTRLKGSLGSQKQAAWTHRFSLDQIKETGRVMGGTINDVLLTAATGALRRYLQLKGDSVLGINIRIAIPVNLRPLSDAYRLGNRFGLVFLKLPIHVDSPGTRLQVVKQHMDMIKRSLEAIVVLGMLGVIGASPHWVQRLVTWFLSRKTTAILTNVPGPRQSLYLAQAPIQSIMFWVPQTGTVGLGISILSYAGHVQIGLTADSELIPDLELLVDSFEHELTRLIHTT